MEFIRGTTLVHLKIRCWSGEKKANRELDIKVGKDGKLPPKKLLDLGRKKIFPPEALNPLSNLRKVGERACLAQGTRFMGGYAVPDDAVDEAVQSLEDAQLKFGQELTKFMDGFDTNRDKWLRENAEFAEIFDGQLPDRETVKSAFHFSFKLYKLDPVEGFEPDEEEIANQVLHEIGQECWGMADRMIKRKTAMSGKKLKESLEPFMEKLDALSFGNGRILTVLNEFRALHGSVSLERIDKDHPKWGQTLTFLTMCSDSSKLEQIISGDFSVSQMINAMSAAAAKVEPIAPASMPATSTISTPVTGAVAGAYF
tara:strand:+ start:15891 stop:16829 length:939 start_codon:yes stop_codon:yes gene_type:complete